MKKIILLIAFIGILIVAYYAISPIFDDIEVDDAEPSAVGEKIIVEESEVTPSVSEDLLHKVMGTSGHPAEGTVRVVQTEEGQVIRYENFSTINGPQLHVYIAKDLEAKEFVDLGPIKGTQGNINYAVPDNVDLDEYKYVMYWCVPFGVLFNYAEVN
ncbi:DM13 domain-containing protein [Patescibacteria group bacterium]